MPKIICICILLIYFIVISKKGGHYCPHVTCMIMMILECWRRCCHVDFDESLTL